jgi:NAD(P)-dependent dehydrogenase (short-subunit alcohol dehydrogenase family)
MRILIIGGNGTIGRTVTASLSARHEVSVAGRKSEDFVVDISDSESIKQLFEAVGKVDAVVNIAGEAKWDEFENLSEADYYIGIRSKLMGQVNLVRIGKDYINPGGSITLTTGVLADDPVPKTTSAAMVNGAIHSFVKAVVLELDNIRVNAVSAGLVEDSYEKYKDFFPGHTPVSMKKVVEGYLKSVEGTVNGQIIRVLN